MTITNSDVKRAKTQSGALALVNRAAVEYQSASKAGELATVSASRATYAAYQAGIVTGDSRMTAVESPLESKGAFCKRFGVKGQTIFAAWIAYGYALVALGMQPSQRLWLGVSYSDVKDVIFADGATSEAVMAIVDTHIAADGTRIKRTQEGQPDKVTVKGADGSESDVTLDHFQLCMAALEQLDKNLWQIRDRDAFAKVEARLLDVHSREVARREKQAANARKAAKTAKAAPRKRAPRKTAAKAA